MNNTNVKNIPLNNLYQFDNNKYVWRIEGNYIDSDGHNKPIILTEVYELGKNDTLDLISSGKLIENDDVYKDYHDFTIFDYNKNVTTSFQTTMNLTPAPLMIIYKLRDTISKMYHNEKKSY